MRMCNRCGKGKWQGAKKDGKFVCVECLEKERESKVEEVEAKEVEDEG